MKKFQDEQKIVKRLADLPREIAPKRDVWPQISRRISRNTSTGKPAVDRIQLWPMAAAASFLIMITVGLLLNKPWKQSEWVSPAGEPGFALTSEANRSYLAGSNMTGELEYQAAFKEFMALSVSPGTGEGERPEWIEQGWNTLREVEIELLAAIKMEPDNHFLNLRMAALRGHQIDLLKQITTVDKTSRRITT